LKENSAILFLLIVLFTWKIVNIMLEKDNIR